MMRVVVTEQSVSDSDMSSLTMITGRPSRSLPSSACAPTSSSEADHSSSDGSPRERARMMRVMLTATSGAGHFAAPGLPAVSLGGAQGMFLATRPAVHASATSCDAVGFG